MAYISRTTTVITLFSVLSAAKLQSYTYDYGYNPNTKQYTRKIDIRQGSLQGIVVYLGANTGLPPVEQYLGIPYAAPPMGPLRFMPTGSAPSWRGIRYADTFGHVCPQNLPNSTNMEKNRKIYFERLKKYLTDESEDCLYLNIYAPFQEKGRTQKYPVMVFIHGESFEWNSGNPYDGSVLAAYGQVIVVTLNFRLGILGFLRTGPAEDSPANFGLIDQIAALAWIKENIAKFGGDETTVTLFGHGTGAACVGHLMSSHIIEKGNTTLFQRAILMSGSPLSDWALATKSIMVTLQVSKSLNCPIKPEEFTACLRKRRLQDLMDASVNTPPYSTKFGPVVDNLIIPNEPYKMLTKYSSVVKNLELMYGVTEIESAHHLGVVALVHGMLEKERNVELRDYLKTRCEIDPASCFARTVENYDKYYRIPDESVLFRNHEGETPARNARDMLLDVLSDAGYAAPILMTAKLHSALNPQSYFYVFGHSTSSKDYVLNKSVHGDELPYVFGAPLDGPKFHFGDHYSNKEKLLSELVMSLWCNFAYSGNPSVSGTRLFSKLSQTPYFDIMWPEFDVKNQRYLYLSKAPEVRQFYRRDEMVYWNDFFPLLSDNRTLENVTPNPIYAPPPPIYPRKPKFFERPDYSVFPFPTRTTTRSTFRTQVPVPDRPRLEDETPEDENHFRPRRPAPEQSNTMNVLIAIGAIFLLANVIIFAGLYFKCAKMRKRNSAKKSSYEEPTDAPEEVSEKQPKIEDDHAREGSGCNLITRLINSKSSKSEDTYEAVKTNESCSSKRKLTRQVSSSTIDAHTKVRDWIAQEIVHRYSPKFLRRARHQTSTESKKHKEEKQDVKEAKPLQIRASSKMTGSNSTLGQSPTRPVSPVEEVLFKDPIKPSLIPVQKHHKKAEKISVAVDATPAGRGSSVLRQEPIELTKSLDYGSFDSENDVPLRRSVTLDDFSAINCSFKNSANINLKFQPIAEPTIIKIEHNHSKSDPADICSSTAKKLKTFEPQDVNVTSRDEVEDAKPLTPEESLQTIKRRNFPKVLPDLPGDSKQAMAHKRRSMPAPSHLFLPIPENSSVSQPNSPTGKGYLRQPPAPPPRISSSLGKNSSTPNIQSQVLLAQEPPAPEEPEVACNNLYIGPLIPSRENRKVILKPADSYRYNNQPIYDNLNPKPVAKSDGAGPKTVITSDPNSPVRRMEPKVIIKPKISRTISDPAKNRGPRVVVNDHMLNQGGEQKTEGDDARNNPVELDHLAVPKFTRKQKSSHIPTVVKGCNNGVNKESSSDSTPSESSDTGTVVKRA